MRARHAALPLLALLVCEPVPIAQTQDAAPSTYLTPPQAIVDILDAPPAPEVEVSPARDLLLLERRSMPPLEELAQPMLQPAGQRINPRTNGQHHTPGITGISLQPVRGGSAREVQLPEGAAMIREFHRPTRHVRTWIVGSAEPEPRQVWDLSQHDRYRDPGEPVERLAARTILQDGHAIYLTGDGASPEGDRPFLDRLDLQTLRRRVCSRPTATATSRSLLS